MVHTDPPNSVCPDFCWSCQRELPKNRIDRFDTNYNKFESEEEIDHYNGILEDGWEYEKYDPNDTSPNAIGAPINYYGPNGVPVPAGCTNPPRFVIRKVRKDPSAKKKDKPVKEKKKEEPPKPDKPRPTVNQEQKEFIGSGVLMLQENFKIVRKAVARKKTSFEEEYKKFENCLDGQIKMKDAFDMVRVLSNYQQFLKDDYQTILQNLVEDFKNVNS